MKKKLLLFLFMLGSFLFSVGSISAVEISGGKYWSYEIVQLTATNTASSGAYKDYASYFLSYYQSSPVKYYREWTQEYLSLGTEPFSFLDGQGEYRVGEFSSMAVGFCFRGAQNCYTQAGTYAFLLKHTYVTPNVTILDKSEYIMYVNIKSDLSFGSVTAKKVKNSDGSNADGSKVTEMSFDLLGVYSTKYNNVLSDFYLSNEILGDYADLTRTVTYNVSFFKDDKGVAATGYIYDSTGVQKSTVTFSSVGATVFTLGHNEALVIKPGTFYNGTKANVGVYNGLDSAGYTFSSDVKGGTVTGPSTEEMHYSVITLSGSTQNYAKYKWTYPDSNVPDAGVIIKVLPYVIMVSAVLVVGLLLILTRRKKVTDITE